MRQIIYICCASMLLLTLLLVGLANATTYYVSTGGNDSNPGTMNSPFAAIQHAIDVSTAGDTVFVAAGTYNENISMKSGISVIGNSPANTIIEAQIAIVEGVVNFHDVDYAILKNFTITIQPTQKQAGIDRGVVFDGNTGYSTVLQNCIIYGVQYGIYVWAPATPGIVNNVLDGKGTGQQGIYIGNSATSPHIVNNIITGWSTGIHVVDETAPYTNDPNIEFCDVWGNTDNYIFASGSPLADAPFTPVPTTYTNRGDTSVDPLFVDSANVDYHLQTGSPCINTGFSNGEFQNPYISNPGDGGFDRGAYGGGGNTFINLSKTGSGSGEVTSSGGTWLSYYPATGNTVVNSQLYCPSSCTHWVANYPDPCSSCDSFYVAGSAITLTAAADAGSYFAGWSGAVAPGAGATTTQLYYLYYTPVTAAFDQCTYSVAPTSANFPYIGGTGTIDVTAPGDCPWNVNFGSLPSSMTITSGMKGTGNGTIGYSVSQNHSGLSYGSGFTLLVQGNVNFQLTQEGDPNCTYSLSPASQNFSTAGGTGSINVATNPGCTWNAGVGSPGIFQPPFSWIHINSGSSGSGSGTVDYTVDPLIGGVERTGWIGVAAQAFDISQRCTYEINPYKAVLPSSGGTGYSISVIASDSSCQWSVASNDPWLTITSGGSGTGSGTVTYSASANTGSARNGTITVAGRTFTVSQIDNSLQETMVPASGGTWVTATISNNTAEALITARPTCCNTYFWMTDAQGNMVPPRDRVCEPVGIPDSLVSLPPGGSFEITCDLSEVAYLSEGITNVMATYVNPLAWDPDYDPSTGACRIGADRDQCYDLRPIVIPSSVAQVNIGASASVEKKLAVLGFNPRQWDPQWASVDGPAISANITDFDGAATITCSSIDLTSIRMNGQIGIVPGSCTDAAGGITVQFNRSAAVLSLGTLAPGMTATVTAQGGFTSNTDIFYGQGSVDIVEDTGTLVVQSNLNTVGTGSEPDVSKTPITSIEVRVFDKQQGSCAAGYGVSWKNYPAIWANCDDVDSAHTDAYGAAIFSLPQGDYLVIGSYETIYPGVSVGSVAAGDIDNKYLQVIKTAEGKSVPAKYQKFTGSELLIIEPEYVEWSGSQEVYPFVLVSSGDWSVTTSVIPPEGFVADEKSLSADVNSEVTALQFTVTDVGSKWVSTKVKHKIKHKGKSLNVESKIGIKLAPGLQKKLGLGEFGEE